MAAIDDPRTLGRTRLSFASEAEIDEFVDVLGKFERGEITPDEWRVYRLVRGTYGQRQSDVQMLRVKVPQGILEGPQLLALADVSERYSRGFGHITTRQNMQFHFVKLSDIEAALRLLADVGLTTREACGNSVRNITACPYAGVAHDEVFDITPYAEALTRYLLRHPLSSSLPRKFKIAFEGCPTDHAAVSINDLGLHAVIDGHGATATRGFRVTVGGGTAILCRTGHVLYEFLPASELFDVAEAIVRVFHRMGDRVHRQANRMKFLIRKLGWEGWREEFDRSLEAVRAEGGARLPFDPETPPVEEPPDQARVMPPSAAQIERRAMAATTIGPGIHPEVRPTLTVVDEEYSHWLETNVREQKQDGYALVTATLTLGDITGEQMRIIADLAASYGDGSVRVTLEQDLVFRWVPLARVPELYTRLAAAGLALPDAATIADVTSCPGAESCRIAVTQSRGLGKVLHDHLRAQPALIAAAPDASIKISGCPNGCGQHHIASIGFQGGVRKVGGRAVPQYFVMVGGSLGETEASFGRVAAKVPVRRMTEVLDRLLALYVDERRDGESATAFFRRVDIDRAKHVLADLETLTAEDAVDDDFIDLAEEEEFRPDVQEGECAS